MANLRFLEKRLPRYQLPAKVPIPSPEVYQARYRKMETARKHEGYDCLVIYADREHYANLSWLTGFDPRFEEALWIQGPSRKPVLIVGNECYDLARAQLQLSAEIYLYQPFSLPGQDQSKSTDLRRLLQKAGLVPQMRCGLVGWKPRSEVDVPYWIVSTICELTGTLPANATAMLTAPPDGLRLTLEPEMVQFCEYAASLSSEAVKAWLLDLREDISERDSAKHLQSYGLELSCHPMVNFGRSIPSGLKSPRNAVARRGEYAQCAFGVIGGLTCRAGRLIDSRMPDADHYLELVENYLTVVSAWYGAVRVGVTAGEVVAAAVAAKSALWEFALNPGHLLNLEEWAASPFVTGSNVPLRSGNAVQQDIIPIPRNSPAMINMEDGLILADEDLRAELRKLDRSLVARCETRRALMEELGYSLSDDILPLSNVAGVFFPFLLETQLVASLR